MKLVEILATELAEWPENAEELGQCYDGDLHLRRGGSTSPEYLGIFVTKCDSIADDKVTRAQWQAERDRQKGGEWKRHRAGRNQPVMAGVRVEVKLRCGDIQQGNAHEFIWLHSECDAAANIMQYRIISQQQAEDVKLSRLEARMLFSEPCIIYPESTEAKTDQIDGPIKWRDTIVELEAHAEDIQREIASLHARLTDEGFSLIRQHPSIPQPELAVDMSDWRNWKAGDIVECTYSSCDNVYTEGKHYDVDHVTSQYAKVADDCGPDSFCHINDDEEVKFRLVR